MMKTEIEQSNILLEKMELLYFSLEDLFYELDETKKIELTQQVTKKLYDILSLYKDFKIEFTKTYNIEILLRDTKYDPLEPMFNLIIDASILAYSIYQELLNDNIDKETLFILDNIMSRIQRTILFFHYFRFVI